MLKHDPPEADSEASMPVARHEASDIGERFIWGAVASMLALLLLSGLLVSWLYPQSRTNRTLNLPLPLYPAPRLQTDPSEAMRRFRAAELARLESYGWLDKPHDVVHIPIADAMAKVAAEGVPQWPAATAAPP